VNNLPRVVIRQPANITHVYCKFDAVRVVSSHHPESVVHGARWVVTLRCCGAENVVTFVIDRDRSHSHFLYVFVFSIFDIFVFLCVYFSVFYFRAVLSTIMLVSLSCLILAYM